MNTSKGKYTTKSEQRLSHISLGIIFILSLPAYVSFKDFLGGGIFAIILSIIVFSLLISLLIKLVLVIYRKTYMSKRND